MQLRFKQAKSLKSCIDAIVNLVDEGTFEASSSGLHLRTMDPSQIAMIDFNMPSSAMESIDAPDKTRICLNLVDFSKILSRTRADESLDMQLDEKGARLHLSFEGFNKRLFKMPLLESSAGMPKEPNVPFDATLKVKGGAFKDMLRDAAMLSSHVILSIDDSGFHVEAKGDAGDVHSESNKDADFVVSLQAKGKKSRAMFPCEYMEDMIKACPDDAVMEINLKSDAPIKLSYEIDSAKFTYYLAPRVENE
ncbi:proliferating cell nuclear antigen (pcna) [Candidatus Micrarchaeota archaeon]|nr:proliferating cell nuclear antigen (pcna) [Candidatus Micrarchaeota archaeon]